VSPQEVANRTAKASRLAKELLGHGATLADVEALPDAGWSMVAELAGDNPPSDLTKAAVIGLFREADTALWPDPFAGFDRDETAARIIRNVNLIGGPAVEL
jgi:hypothetical protein